MNLGPRPAGQPWSPAEDAQLLALLDSKMDRPSIARKGPNRCARPRRASGVFQSKRGGRACRSPSIAPPNAGLGNLCGYMFANPLPSSGGARPVRYSAPIGCPGSSMEVRLDLANQPSAQSPPKCRPGPATLSS